MKTTMKMKISETTIVRPASATPHHVLRLSHLDNDRNLRVSIRYLRAYLSRDNSCQMANDLSAADPFHVITTALSSTLVHYYPFSGTLRGGDGDRLELHCAEGDGIPVIQAIVDCSLESLNFLDDPKNNSDLVESLVPDPNHDDQLANPLILQVTMFQCGGLLIVDHVNDTTTVNSNKFHWDCLVVAFKQTR